SGSGPDRLRSTGRRCNCAKRTRVRTSRGPGFGCRRAQAVDKRGDLPDLIVGEVRGRHVGSGDSRLDRIEKAAILRVGAVAATARVDEQLPACFDGVTLAGVGGWTPELAERRQATA